MADNRHRIIPEPLNCRQVEERSGQPVSACYQCEKCTNGCPLTFAMDIYPHRIMHSLRLGMLDQVINSDTIWVCASCETCTTRCPNDIDIAHVMDTLRQLSMSKGVKAAQKQAPIFHRVFLQNVQRLGRMHELSMGVEYSLKSAGVNGLLKQSSLGLGMIRKGKMKIVPGRLSAGQEVKEIFRKSKGNQ
jgi:heterodisulfide reductase subunit C2